MPLPNPGMSFTPFDPLPASDLDDLVQNIEALQDWTAYDNDTLPFALLEDGAVVQYVSTNPSAVATGTTLIPHDDTVPQNNEGTEFMTLAITPKSTTNILVIEVFAQMGSNGAPRHLGGAIFQDSTAGALAAGSQYHESADRPIVLGLRHRMVAGTTSATTFKFRAGTQASATTTFNGYAAGRLFGAIPKSSMTITEYKAS